MPRESEAESGERGDVGHDKGRDESFGRDRGRHSRERDRRRLRSRSYDRDSDRVRDSSRERDRRGREKDRERRRRGGKRRRRRSESRSSSYSDDSSDRSRGRRRRRSKKKKKSRRRHTERASGFDISNDQKKRAANIALAQQALIAAQLLQQQGSLTRKARRVHFSGIPIGITPITLQKVLTDAMSSAGLLLPTAPPNSAPINEVTIGADGRYAFVEFRSVFEAGNVLMLDGLTIIGSTFRVQRPKDYTPAPPELVMTIIPPHIANANAATLVQGIGFSGSGASSGILGSAKSLVNTQAQTPENELIALHGMTRRARRLHVGNLPQGANLTPQMLQQYLNGMLISKGLHDHRIKGDPVVACNIPQGKFGFIELRTVHETTAALTLDGVELGDNHLKVQRPHDYQPVPDEIIKKFAKLSGHPDPQDFKANGPSHKTTLKGGAGDTKAPEGT